MDEKFQTLLDEAVQFHGHLCGGQVIGVRMAIAALRELAIREPRSREGRDLVIFVEADRCATDAIIAVTGRTPGKRSIKMMDYGKVAATFVESRTGKAIRISVRGDSGERIREMAQLYFPKKDKKHAMIEALKTIAEDRLLHIQQVTVALKPEDLPGESIDSVFCGQCGEEVRDRRHIKVGDATLCRPCASGNNYYEVSGTSVIRENDIVNKRAAHASL